MPTSELSDALNPNVAQSRRYDHPPPQFNLPPPALYTQDNSSSYAPHRSELEFAVVEPTAPPRPRDPFQELLRFLATARDAEQKRRLAWEQEQEAKSTQMMAAVEQRFQVLEQEITDLKSYISLTQQEFSRVSATSFHVQHPTASSIPTNLPVRSSPPSFPRSQYPPFDQESSTMSAACSSLYIEDPLPAEHNMMSTDAGSGSFRKRSSPLTTPTDDESSDEDSVVSEARPFKRTSGHDTRCLTIQHAMRRHIYRTMAWEEDKPLPDSPIEGAPVADNDPVRFIWQRTVKQSPHNASMKAKIIADIIANRQLYQYVPDKDFNPDTLDGVFDQTFTTLRQKFRFQRDTQVASKRIKREAVKSAKVRRMTRKRVKLGNRTTSRHKLEIFSHSTFDGALQLECMSSEDSEDESSEKTQVLRVRGLPWRSSRLLKLYGALDEEYSSRVTIKRGTAMKEKCLGPMKDGYLVLPPKGVASWMVSRRWLRNMGAVHKDLEQWLVPLLLDPPGFDWHTFKELGDETDGEEHSHPPYTLRQVIQHTNGSSSSLQYALVL